MCCCRDTGLSCRRYLFVQQQCLSALGALLTPCTDGSRRVPSQCHTSCDWQRQITRHGSWRDVWVATETFAVHVYVKSQMFARDLSAWGNEPRALLIEAAVKLDGGTWDTWSLTKRFFVLFFMLRCDWLPARQSGSVYHWDSFKVHIFGEVWCINDSIYFCGVGPLWNRGGG